MRRGRAGEGGLGWGFEGVCWGGVVAVAVEGSGCSGPGLSPSRPPQPSTFFWLPYPQVLHPSIGAFSWSLPPPEEPSSPLGLLRQSHTGAQTALDIHQRGGFSPPPSAGSPHLPSRKVLYQTLIIPGVCYVLQVDKQASHGCRPRQDTGASLFRVLGICLCRGEARCCSPARLVCSVPSVRSTGLSAQTGALS